LSKLNKSDAELLLKIYEMSRTGKLMDSMMWLLAEPIISYDDFKKKYPAGSEGYQRFIDVASFYEFVGVLVYYKYVNPEPIHDFFAYLWDKSEPIVRGMQKEYGSDFLENYEWLAMNKREWSKTRPKKFPDRK
jgi:hypothetical protein